MQYTQLTEPAERRGCGKNEPWYWVKCLIFSEENAKAGRAEVMENLQPSRLQITVERGRFYLGFRSRFALRHIGKPAHFQPDQLFGSDGWRMLVQPEDACAHEMGFPAFAYVISRQTGEHLVNNLGIWLPELR